MKHDTKILLFIKCKDSQRKQIKHSKYLTAKGAGIYAIPKPRDAKLYQFYPLQTLRKSLRIFAVKLLFVTNITF
ncbi:hypothetical protein IW18_13715 [Flavobacterium hibernum]|uniref:Uncharacterized protein n=1 Tax=Flavobacterium hibernum TaxID=37752 RepID=A0A0D0ETY4_9FLAO|nr:hypothetical protein IW18_13715 [Flavobacterium hibernum]OXA87024.1 hypothetical protein B0A73_11965 [Flavobacterium hibernum]